MATVGDRYLLTLRAHSVINSQSVQNVFAYELDSGSGGAPALNDAFAIVVLPDIQAVLVGDTFIDDLYTVNLDDPADYDDKVISSSGLVSGDAMPSFVAWEFEYVRATRAVNNGRKAFGMVSESSVTIGEADAAIIGALTTLAVTLSAPVPTAGLTSTWLPRIFRRPGTYSSGVVAAPGQFFPISDVRYRKVSTQSTRKVGRGS
jgi:hypothetical protein